MDRTSPAARNASDTEVIDHKLYCTLFIYLAYEYSKRFVQPVLQPVANCKRTFRRQCLSDCRATGQKSFPRSCERAKAVTSAGELRTTSCCLSVMLCHSAPLCNVLVCLCVCLHCEMWPGHVDVATHQQPPVGRQQLGRGRQIWIDSARTVAGARARAAASVML